MKRSLLLLVVLISCLIDSSELFAQAAGQDTILARIVYTNSDRRAILAKTVGVNKVDTLFTSKGSLIVKNLAVLASTRDGKSLLIGGKAVYPNNFQSFDSIWFFGRLDAPFTNNGSVNSLSNPPTIGGMKVLKNVIADLNGGLDQFGKILPLGVLSPDETQWYSTPSKTLAGTGDQWFFHGSFSGTGTVDSLVLNPPDQAASIGGFHMTNLCTSSDGNTMLAVVIDNTEGDKPRAQLFSWTPSQSGGGFAFLSTDFSGAMQALRPTYILDSSFAFTLRVTGSSPAQCQLGLQPNLIGDIQFYDFAASGTINSLKPDPNLQISRSVLPNLGPKHIQFFTGYTGSTKDPDDDKEVLAPEKGYPNGNGGDMMFSPSGDSIVFVTCDTSAVATPKASGIYIYSFSSGQLTLVENDTTKMERQPIFTASVVHKYVPPPYKVGTGSVDNTTLDFGTKFTVDPPTTMTVKLTPNNNSLITVTQAVISGSDQANFSVTLNPTLPASISLLGNNKFYSFPVKFTPNAAKTYNATLTIHYQDSLKEVNDDSIITVNLTGIGSIKQGVSASAPSSFDLSVVPNPFTSSTKITVSAREAGSTSIEIRDLLGKEIYSSKQMMLAQGEHFSYTLDASALHLAPGEYFVIVRSGSDEVTRQVIYIK